mgnify:FL=1
MEALWPAGYREETERVLAEARWFAGELDARGYDVVAPELPLVAVDLPERLFDALREEGWRVTLTRRGEARVVLMPHVTRETLRAFLDDCDRIA